MAKKKTKSPKRVASQDELDVRFDAIAAETMVGDLMALVTDELKNAPDVWQKLGEVEQQQMIDRIRTRVQTAVGECVRIIATEDFTRIRASIDSIAVKDGIKAVLTLSRHDPKRHDLVDAQGSGVFIVLADAEAFGGGAFDVKPDPDQQALTLNEIEKVGRKQKDDGRFRWSIDEGGDA